MFLTPVLAVCQSPKVQIDYLASPRVRVRSVLYPAYRFDTTLGRIVGSISELGGCDCIQSPHTLSQSPFVNIAFPQSVKVTLRVLLLVLMTRMSPGSLIVSIAARDDLQRRHTLVSTISIVTSRAPLVSDELRKCMSPALINGKFKTDIQAQN
jgi:hypothetical protein